MRKILTVFALVALLSCKKGGINANTCHVSNPLTELQWLKDRASQGTSIGDLTIYQALYRGQTVFAIDLFIGPDAGSYGIYQCDGAVICTANTTIAGEQGDCGTIPQELTNPVVILEKKR